MPLAHSGRRSRRLTPARFPRGPVVIVMGLAVVAGLIWLAVRAAGPGNGFEIEGGQRTGNAAVVSGGAYSGGQAIRFAPNTGRQFYVDCANGNDGADGLDPARAWKTLAKASAASFDSGETLYLKRGCSFVAPLAIRSSGVAGNPFKVDAYGSGAKPEIIRRTNGAAISVSATYTVIQNLKLTGVAPGQVSASDATCPSAPIGNVQGVSFESGSHHNILRDSDISGFYAGVYIRSNSHHNQVTQNQFLDNIMMSPLDRSADNDAGAFGVLLWGDDNEIAYNRISGSNACSYDYGRDGAAVELYGGQRNRIHHNIATASDAFSELGNSRTADTVYAYNLFYSANPAAIFLNTRGSGSSYGPVVGTKAYNNTVYLTGSSSQGIVCSSGCSASILTARGNVLWAAKSLYADAAFAESHNLFWRTGGSPVVQNAGSSNVSPSSKKADPMFVSPTAADFRLLASSPALNAGSPEVVAAGFTSDLVGVGVPRGAAVDIGAYEQ